MFTRTCLALALVVLTFALLPLSARVSAADEPVLVVVGATFPANDISLAALKDSFAGRAVMIAGKRLIPINHPPNSALRVAFDRAVLGLEPAAIARFWVDARIRAEGMPPTTAATPDLAMRIVASLAHTVSYGTKAMLNPKVKAISVDGKSAADGGYALKP